MFVRNAWYIGALSYEVPVGGILSRTILGEPFAFFRMSDGRLSVLADRCPHRFAPLSLGSITNRGIRCGYHGMEFDPSGRCIGNPVCATDPVPEVQVGALPFVEKQGLIWVWPGSAVPDRTSIPDYSAYGDQSWTAETHYMRVAANYLLLVDNLMDLSHISFVHPDILGNDDVVDQHCSETVVSESGITEKRLVTGGAPIPVWREVLGPSVAQVDLWMDIHWSNASNIMLDVGSTPTGHPRSAGAGILNLDCITPETATTSHYFYGHARQYERENPELTKFWSDAMTYAFLQDKAMVEAVQTRMGNSWDIFRMEPPPVINRTDRAAVQVRRRLARALKEEKSAETYSLGKQSAKRVVSAQNMP